jgi:hypothetical protein
VFSNTQNTALVEVEGFDLEANYTFQALGGNWMARVLGNYQPVNQNQAYPGAPFTFTSVPPNGDLIAKTHINGSLTYQLDKWTFGVQDRWLGKYSRVSTYGVPQVYVDPWIRAKNYVDVDIEREFEAGGFDMIGYFNVQNFFNAKGQVYENSAVQGIHYPIPAEEDIMGRYFTIGIKASL